MVEVEVRLYAALRRYHPHSDMSVPLTVWLDDGATVGDLMATLGIPREETRVVFVNGRRRGEDYVLQKGDRGGIFPPVGGGQAS